MIKPEMLKRGDKVAIVSLSSGILGEAFCKHQLELGIKRLEMFGLIPIFMPNALKGVEYIKNNPEARASDLKEAFYNVDIKGIICAIGGDDTYLTFPYLLEDNAFVKYVNKHPKVFVGFSDTTNNHLMFYKLGLKTYYGLNFLSDLAELDKEMLPYTKDSFKMLFSNALKQEISPSPIWYEERTDFSEKNLEVKRIVHQDLKGYEVLRGIGKVSGNLLGGCLESLYDAMTGNRYPDQKDIYEKYEIFPSLVIWKDKILFIETSEEKPTPSEFSKMIDALDDYGIIRVVKAIIVGKPQDEAYYNEYKNILITKTEAYQTPILYNLNFGHAVPRTILPYDAKVTIDLNSRNITIDEPIFQIIREA